MHSTNLNSFPHRRKNILTGEWILVSPHRTQRPWQGEIAKVDSASRPAYDAQCYLCPGNMRANGERNPAYKNTFVFTNDFSALLSDVPQVQSEKNNLLVSQQEKGICKVVNFSPRHDLTLAEMDEIDIEKVIDTWCNEFENLKTLPFVNHIQIFENKGSMMGNSNPHPHCQIWAQEHVPMESAKELKNFRSYYKKNKVSLLSTYLKTELKRRERIVFENSSFVVLVPFWAVWPFETIIISRRKLPNILSLSSTEKKDFANALKVTTTKYDNLFSTSFPYSAGIHQAPTDGKAYPEWHLHMHFYPPLLRSATIKKFMVGYEMLAEPQRDITAESSAEILRNLPVHHYKTNTPR